jgi:2-dehydro-3-deoxyphosphooctonate aldolase (KDO 8-P synthase)
MKNVIEKCNQAGNNNVTLCERGNSFGYNNLVVDMLNFQIMKDLDVPVIFDATHSLQLPGGLGNAAGGRREYLLPLAKAGLSQCIAGLFIEAHPDPDSAKCDGPCAISTAEIPTVLSQLSELDDFIKNQDSDI